MKLAHLIIFVSLFTLSCKRAPSSNFLETAGDGNWFTKTSYPPEYAPVSAVAIGTETLREQPQLAKEILKSNAKLVVSGGSAQYSDDSLSNLGFSEEEIADISYINTGSGDRWIRDWGPVATVDGQGKYVFYDQKYVQGRESQDQAGAKFGDQYNIPQKDLDVYNEGGNISMCDLGDVQYCIMSDRVFDGVAGSLSDEPVTAENQAKVISNIKNATGAQEVLVLPSLKKFGEGTGHVDMYARSVRPGVMMVNSIPSDADQLAGDSEDELERIRGMRQTLNNAAEQLEQKGFTVERIPSLPPVGNTFYTYSNATPVNGRMLMPVYDDAIKSFENLSDPEPEDPWAKYKTSAIRISSPRKRVYTEEQINTAKQRADILKRGRSAAEEIYTKYGYEVVGIESSKTITEGGAVHCSTLQFPCSGDDNSGLPRGAQ